MEKQNDDSLSNAQQVQPGGSFGGKASGDLPNGKWEVFGGFSLRGLWLGFFLGAVALAAELIWLEPMAKPTHFLLVLLTAIFDGAMAGTAVATPVIARLTDEVMAWRAEVKDKAARVERLETALLKQARLSSTGTKGNR